MADRADQLTQTYIGEIVRLHGVTISIVSDWNMSSRLHFGEYFRRHLRQRPAWVQLSSVDRWSTIEDYSDFRGYAQRLRFTVKKKLAKHLPLAEFPTLTAIIHVLRWHHMRFFMVGIVVYHFVGPKWGEWREIESSMVQETVEQIDMFKFWL